MMERVIGSTYEIIKKIGSGGGGNVFLANHLRLNKKVVLKEDRRKLTTKPDLLRREVDVLKDLSHSYIPQVYDFFIEGENIYTVMDYIDGESLDKPLKRGERFSQRQVISWAIELLQALSYLHSPTHGDPPKGFVHSDIKPANIMRRPNNDICLIDFNIALALGEESVVGCTAGYASPEHYGLDFSTSSNTESLNNSTVTLGEHTETVTMVLNSEDHSASSFKKTIKPDVRSDIYSLGATLYHLLCGKRPAQNALEVIPLSNKEFSPLIVEIISKAMNPNPDMRYQSADEMLDALYSLHERDSRTIRFKRERVIGFTILLLMLVAGTGISFTGLKRMQSAEENLKLAEYSRNAYASGERVKAISLALDALPQSSGIFTPAVSSEAQEALTNALEVYELSDDYRPYKTLELPAEPFDMEMSPDGRTFTCIYAYEVVVYDVDSLEKLYESKVLGSALSEVKYLSNSLIAYAGENGLEIVDFEKQSLLWKGNPTTKIAVSHDGSVIAGLYKDETYATLYDALTGEVIGTADFEGKKQRIAANDIFVNPRDALFELNDDGQNLAVSFEDGSLHIIHWRKPEENLVLMQEESGYTHFEGGFYQKYFAFAASNQNESIFAVIDTAEKEQIGGFEGESRFGVTADERGIFLSYENLLVNIHPETGEQRPLITTSRDVGNFTVSDKATLVSNDKKYMYFDQNAGLISEKDTDISVDFILINGNKSVIGSMNSPILRIEQCNDHSSNNYILYDAGYTHDEARISHNGEKLMLFAYDGFYILDSSGNLICEKSIPNEENVHDQQYIRTDNSSILEVTYNNGTVVNYDALTGDVLSEEQREQPDLSLNEEYFTEDYKVTAELHGSTKLFYREDGQLIRELPEDAYLTYVTQISKYLILQYITVDGYQYAKLLNSKCEEIAVLPYLSDIYEGQLIFDCPGGKLRKQQIYSLDELIQMGKEVLEGER